ncbi:MAG: S1C family serine protease [Planctomycetota bacterium]|jgi:serine protease Do
MNRLLSLSLFTLLASGTSPAQEAQDTNLVDLQTVLRSSIDRIAPSIVSIETFGGVLSEERRGNSTGLVISRDGWVLISRFAIEFKPSTILVTLSDGRSFPASRGGEDSSRGIALLRIEADDLPVPELLNPDELRVGQWAFALGRTFGKKSPSVHMGIVSAKERIFGRAIQVDAYTSPANYGGPVIDLQGRVVGLSVPLSPAGRDAGADWYDSGIGFAATLANGPEIIERLKAGEFLHRAWLGIQNSPAHLGPGARDLILSVGEVPVRNPFHLQVLLGSRMAGEAVHLRYKRGEGEARDLTVFLAEMPEEERQPQSKEKEVFQLPWEQEKKKD